MSNNAAASRMRNNLKRDYGIKVFHIGRPILCIRIPKADVSGFDKLDSDIIYDRIHANLEQMRPEEIRDVFIISDSDHLLLSPDVFFSHIFKESRITESGDIDISESKTRGSLEVTLDDPTNVEDLVYVAKAEEPVKVGIQEPVELEIEEPIEVGSEESVELEIEEPIVVRIEEPVESVIPEPVEEEAEEFLDVEVEMPVVEKAEEPVEAYTEKTEAKTIEEPAGSGSKDTAKPQTEKMHDTLKEDQVVGKILTDFARNGQKKKLAVGRLKSGRRAEVLTKSKRGRYVRYRMPGQKITDIAIAPTVRAAAHHAKDGQITIKKGDLREKIRRRRVSTLINIVFDTSGSMDEQDKIRITTGVVLALLKDAYQRRDRVSLITYSGRSAELVLPFTSSVEAAKRYLENVPFGGTTPMASGLLVSLDVLLRELKKEPSAVPIMVLVTDGTANVPLSIGGNIKREIMQVCSRVSNSKINALVVDISNTGSKLAVEVSHKCNGRYYHPVSLSKEALYNAIKEERDDTAGYAAKTIVSE
ncbi:MAG: VWA domain-containing protein [Methanosarcinaceae archaeon]|nr:VWA domain-containing protein [Methanosarcinaceae archaeon]